MEFDQDDFLAQEVMEEEQRKSRPDYRVMVYCDQHLGVRMHLALSHGMIESGERSADVNPMLCWRCPKAGCNRSYEPMMFGYFEYGREMGSQIQSNPKKQPRCNQAERPFMYIGKVGAGRRYLCPLYKCTEVGQAVAKFVTEEEIEIPSEPLDGLRKEERQRIEEMSVFKSFASVAPIPIDEGSAMNADQPNPDIRCNIGSQTIPIPGQAEAVQQVNKVYLPD